SSRRRHTRWPRDWSSDVCSSDLGDHPTGVSLFAAIMTALYQRDRTGRGTMVSTSLLANGLWWNATQIQAALCGARVEPRPPREEIGRASCRERGGGAAAGVLAEG